MALLDQKKAFQREAFNYFWQFLKQPIDTTIETVTANPNVFEPVTLPHDWLIVDTKHLYETSSGWYKKSLEVDEVGQFLYYLKFDGVYMEPTIYINGEIAFEWKYGYTAFIVDLTPYIRIGTNEIMVQVRHEAPNSRWYSGAGIYRDVWLIKKQMNHLVEDGIYVHIKQNKDAWQVEIETEVNCSTNGILKQTIIDQEECIQESSDLAQSGNNLQILHIEAPKLWSPNSPKCYQLVTELWVDDILVDQVVQSIGFKSVVMDPETGFWLNGESMKLNGVCEHHDLGALGAAFNKAAMRNRMLLLKKMGVNALRTAHNMPAKGFMELADELGFFVISEGFDMWQRAKNPYDYARFFDKWIHKDVASWIRRDRNHVSLLMWSIGNEIYDTHADAQGQVITNQLMALVTKHDKKANGKITIGSNFMPWENAQKCADLVGYVGYNYAEKYYENHHQEHPDWVIYGSETGSIVQSRGIYHFPLNTGILAEDDYQCSALGNSTTSWGAKSMEACITKDQAMAFSLGQFIWTGFDYIGEPTPYDTKNSYFGQIDTAGFEKDSYYVYQSAWTKVEEAPMVHIFPYWQFNEGQLIDVRVCSNAYSVELFLNEQPIGNLVIDHKGGCIPTWQIPFTKGRLKAIAYDASGNQVAMCIRSSFGTPKQLRVKVDKAVIPADGISLSEITIQALDAQDQVVENANLPVKIHVEGPGVLLGLDNGDSTDYTPYKGSVKRLFSGKLKAFVGSTLEAGKIKVTIEGKDLEPKTVEIEAKSIHLTGEAKAAKDLKEPRSGQIKEASVAERIYAEIPVQMIQLSTTNGQKISKDCLVVQVNATVYPENATDHHLTWKVVTDTGAQSIIGKVTPTSNGCLVSASGDGNFRLRCMANNGKDYPEIISELEFTASDLGIAYKNPYEFIGASLYDYKMGEVGNGNERGISTDHMEATVVAFEHVDFGAFGSDLLTLPIFAFETKVHEIEIWEGIPGSADSQLIDQVTYEIETIWNLYQPQTYQLSRRIKGITTIAFVFHSKLHLKGFEFMKIEKAYAPLNILSCDLYYGDHFRREPWGMAEIGNNVAFAFEDMDFNQGTNQIEICGRSRTNKNTIRIQFTQNGEASSQVVEYDYTEDFVVKSFNLEAFAGKGKIEFIFLPGSAFDFKWFRFIKIN